MVNWASLYFLANAFEFTDAFYFVVLVDFAHQGMYRRMLLAAPASSWAITFTSTADINHLRARMRLFEFTCGCLRLHYGGKVTAKR